MGFKAVEILLDMIEGKSVAATTCLAPTLIVRHSCGCKDTSLVCASVGSNQQVVSAIESLDSRRDIIVQAIADSIGKTSPERAHLERLVSLFLGELRDEAMKEFLLNLEALLYEGLRSDSDIMA